MKSYPLFNIKRKLSTVQYTVLDFVKGTKTYLLICKPLPENGTGDNSELIEEDIHRRAEDPDVHEEILTANECEFSLFNGFLNYSLIAKRMKYREITCEDLGQINFSHEHLELVKEFM